MLHHYENVTTRFLRQDERLILSEETEMPLVIEANSLTDIQFLQHFLKTNSTQLLQDVAKYGAVLFRGFDITSDENFENSILSIEGLKGISDAFMSENGRTHVGNLKYVLHTNAIYKTGGTLYLGGFHTENYYTPDVPSYISFCCLKPPELGGETGLVNTEKLYAQLNADLKAKLEKNNFFVSKWLISEIAERYQVSPDIIEEICQQFDLPIIGKGDQKFILMYKPSVFIHPVTNQKALQINLFELESLNAELRKCFANDYQGKTWFWHRFVWRLPTFVFKLLELAYVIPKAFFYSPKHSLTILRNKLKTFIASKKIKFDETRVNSCFNKADIKQLANSIRNYYCSCLWQKGDILLVDNRKVMHAGMPGSGPRTIRALICNPIEMTYAASSPGHIACKERDSETIGYYAAKGKIANNLPDPTLEIP